MCHYCKGNGFQDANIGKKSEIKARWNKKNKQQSFLAVVKIWFTRKKPMVFISQTYGLRGRNHRFMMEKQKAERYWRSAFSIITYP